MLSKDVLPYTAVLYDGRKKKSLNADPALRELDFIRKDLLLKLSEEDLNPEIIDRVTIQLALSMLQMFVLRSDQDAPKSLKFKGLLHELELPGGMKADELVSVFYDKETPVEDDYHHLVGIGGRPASVALLKASASHNFPILKPRDRAKVLKEYSHKFENLKTEADTERKGFLTIFRSTDIMTEILEGEEWVSLFKPPVEIREETDAYLQKQKTNEHAMQQFGVDETGTQQREIACVAAEAQYEAVTNTGVVHEARITMKMRVPNRAFWHCYFYGLENVPSEYQDMAEIFEEIYLQTIQNNRVDLLRGWTFEEGASGAHKVNGGFQTDIIFARELLYLEVHEGEGEIVQSGNEGFEDICDKAAFLWRGEPMLFEDVLLELVDLIYRHAEGAPLPINPFEKELIALRKTMRMHYKDSFSHFDKIADGVWLGRPAQKMEASLEKVRRFLRIPLERKLLKPSARFIHPIRQNQ